MFSKAISAAKKNILDYHIPVCKPGLRIRSLVFRAICSFFFFKSNESDLLTSLICKKSNVFAHGRYFVKSDVSESLTVAP